MTAVGGGANTYKPSDFGIGQLFEVIPDAVIIGDAQTGRVVLWNPGAAELFGYPPDSAPDLLIEDLVPDELKQAHRKGIARYARGEPAPLVETQQAVELPAIRRDGSRLSIELRLTRLRHQPDESAFVLAVIRDVTERRRLEDALKVGAETNAERAEWLRSFFSMAAHDLQNPLMVVTGVLDAVGSTLGDDGDMAKMISVASRQASHLGQLLEDIMTVARLETGAMTVSPERTELRIDVLEATAGQIEPVEVEVPPGAFVWADRKHLIRIVHNLVSNALKHGAAPVVVSAQPDGDGVRLEVRDAGEGVPADVLDRLFDAFTRSEQAHAPGSGLGLAAVKKLAELTGGRAWYDADAPGGHAFCVWLPAEAASGSS